MSKITEQSVKAFLNGESFKKSNTRVEVEIYPLGKNEVIMYLHNNLIAKRIDGHLYITAAGRKTKTTKERLNGLPGIKIFQKSHLWYLNKEYWDGEFIEIK